MRNDGDSCEHCPAEGGGCIVCSPAVPRTAKLVWVNDGEDAGIYHIGYGNERWRAFAVENDDERTIGHYDTLAEAQAACVADAATCDETADLDEPPFTPAASADEAIVRLAAIRDQ